MPFRQNMNDVRNIRKAAFMTRNVDVEAIKDYVEAGGCFLGDYLAFYAPEDVRWCWHPGLPWCGVKGDSSHKANEYYPGPNHPPGALLIAIRNIKGEVISDVAAYSENMLLHNTYGNGMLTFAINDSHQIEEHMSDNRGLMPVKVWISNRNSMEYRKVKISQ